MLVPLLAWKSLRNRLLTTALTVGTIALSVALLVGVENVRIGMRESFANTIRQTDLIVGARGGTMQLVLYSVFGMGSPTNNLSYASYERFHSHPAVAWTIPYSLGDNHRGFRVVGTNHAFFERYRFRNDRHVELERGSRFQSVFEVVLGSDVASELGYEIGQPVPVAHGLSATGFVTHDDKPFTAVGILRKTSTPLDRALFLPLEGVEAIHVDWRDGAPPFPGTEISAEEIVESELEVRQITSFFLGTKSRMDALRLQREINTFGGEPLLAVLPGVALNQMWRAISYAEDGLRVITIFVVIVGLLGMLVSVYTSLNARRREMAILRAVGAGPGRIIGLLVLEAGFLAVAGSILGVVMVYTLLIGAQPIIESQFGLYLPIRPLGAIEYTYLAGVVAAGFLMGFVPAFKAYRTSLTDGLSVRV